MKGLWSNASILKMWAFRLLLTLACLAGATRQGACAQAPRLYIPATVTIPTNAYWSVTDPSVPEASPYQINLFNPESGADRDRIWSQTKSAIFYGFGVLGVLFAMPEEYTGWEKDLRIFNRWSQNVTEGPEWDRNNWIYNYAGHTYFGGVYYQIARKSGYRQWDSFFYSFLMSTFYWEYGIEAGAEVPSIQDLVVTPIMGWVYGEWAYQTEIKIREHNSTVLGSRTLGAVALIFLDPVDSLGRGINRMTGKSLVKAGYGYFTLQSDPNDRSAQNIYLNITIPLGAAGPEEQGSLPPPKFKTDPVDTGIVGISAGTTPVALDRQWNVKDGLCRAVTLGLYPTPRTSFRLAYARGDLTDQLTGTALRFENYSLDAQYYFNSKHRLRPYLSAGFGEQIWAADEARIFFQWNAGMGLHYRLHRKWALQADWINYYNPSRETHDQTMNMRLIYRFGQGEPRHW